jgi:uncharacterized protein (PEP-CTERM system associated)
MTVSVRTAIAAQNMRPRTGHALPAVVTGLLALAAGPVLAQAPLPPSGLGSGAGFGAPIGAPVGAPIGAPVGSSAGIGPAGTADPATGVTPEPVRQGYSSPQAAFRANSMGMPFAPEPTVIGEQPARSFTFVPSIAAEVLGTDNAGGASSRQRREVIMTLRPSFLLGVDAARLQGRLNYEPLLQFYGSDASNPRFRQNFNGQLLGTVVPDLLYLDVRGAAGFQTARGGFAPGPTETIDRNGLVQTTSFQISPYLLRRFGDLGTLQAGYAFQSVSQNAGGAASSLFTPGGGRFFSNQDFTAHALYAVARTGPAFGRFAFEGRLSSTDYDGTGVLDGAWRRSATVEGRYAITRAIAVLAEVGYESLRYAGTPGFRLEEPVWGAGVRLTFSPESWMTVRYRRRGGFESPAVEAVIGLGGRTRLFARYSEDLTTGAQRAADLLTTTTLDDLGNPVDALTGAPLAQPFTDNFLGAGNSLQRVRRGSVTLTQNWPRDNLSLTFTTEQQRPVSFAPGSIAFEQRGHTVNFAWARALSPETTGLVSVQYGRRERADVGENDVYGLNLGLSTQLRPRLNGYLRYAVTSRGSDISSGRAVQNVVLVGLRQSF